MNKQTILNIVFAVAIVALLVLNLVRKPNCCHSVAVAQGDSVAVAAPMPMAYINADSLLANYLFAQDAQEKLMSKQEDARLKLNTRVNALQKEMADFQNKLNHQAFLSKERAESEYTRLQNKQVELDELQQKLTQEILLENQDLNIQLADSLMEYLKLFNAEHHYQVIMSNNAHDNILMADDAYDITDEVVAGLNARYNK